MVMGWGLKNTSKMENPRGWGFLCYIPSVLGVWIFPGTTHPSLLFLQTGNIFRYHCYMLLHIVFLFTNSRTNRIMNEV